MPRVAFARVNENRAGVGGYSRAAFAIDEDGDRALFEASGAQRDFHRAFAARRDAVDAAAYRFARVGEVAADGDQDAAQILPCAMAGW